MHAVTSTEKRAPLHPDQVELGTYLADELYGGLYCVVDLRRVLRKGQRVRVAMLEHAVTEEIEPWEFGRLARMRLVNHRRSRDDEPAP